MSTQPAPQSSYVVLWAGESPALHDALLEELELSGIAYADRALGEDEVAPDPLPVDPKPRFGFEVAVHHSDIPAAKAILERLLSEEGLTDVELPEGEAPQAQERAGSVDADPTAIEQATVSVWAGDDSRVLEFVTAALQENEIPIRLESAADDVAVVFVPPADASRAREIIREITEGAPPA